MKARLALLLLLPCSALVAGQIVTDQAADIVLGQADFVSSNVPGTPTAASMSAPTAVAVDPTTGKVFVSDFSNNRVLRFSSANAMLSGSDAEAFFGQVSSSSNGHATTQKELYGPTAIAVDKNGTLWIADSVNNRVLRFDHASAKPAVAINADGVLGQPNFSTNNAATPTQATMSDPHSVAVDANGTLWVADTGNNRILRFDDAASAINGANADGVLGQPGFTINFGNGLTTQYTLYSPYGVAADATGHLWVADSFNARVLRFDHAASLSNGALASGVLGQADFVTAAPSSPPTAASLGPIGLAVDAAGGLWVADFSNRRALCFKNAAAKADGAAADIVVGQANFTSKVTATTADGLAGPFGLAVDAAGALWIADTSNHRALHYTPQTITPPSAAGITLTVSGKKKITTTAAKIVIKGGAACADGVARVEYRVGKKGGYKVAAGSTAWTFKAKILPGKNTITIRAVSAKGATSAPVVLHITRS